MLQLGPVNAIPVLPNYFFLKYFFLFFLKYVFLQPKDDKFTDINTSSYKIYLDYTKL